MKVAMVVQPWDEVVSPGNHGSSIAIIAYNLARCLSASHDVIVYARRGLGQAADEIDPLGIRLRRFRVRTKYVHRLIDCLTGFWNISPPYVSSQNYFFHYGRQVAQSVVSEKIEIVHLFTFFQFAPLIRALNPLAKIVLHKEDEMLSLLPRPVVQPALQNIDLFIGCSNYITDRIRSRYPEIKGRCHTVYNGVDQQRFTDPGHHGATEPGVRVLYVGRLSPEKGIHVLIDAFRHLHESFPDCRLDLIGSAGLLPFSYYLGLTQDRPSVSLHQFYGRTLWGKINRQLRQRNTSYLSALQNCLSPELRRQITFHGPIHNREVAEFYRKADIFVFPSVWNEPFGMPITEAMASGLPVVATRGGGIPEFVEDGVTGLLVERGNSQAFAEALSKLLVDPKLRIKMGAAGRAYVLSSLTWNIVSGTLASLYKKHL